MATCGGVGQQVTVRLAGHLLTVSVQDRGPGLAQVSDEGDTYGLGLAGLTGRVESLGGTLTLRNRSDGVTGTELTMAIDLRGVE